MLPKAFNNVIELADAVAASYVLSILVFRTISLSYYKIN